MIRIALIGEIGSGKTFVSKLFNYPVFNADKEVNKIYNSNKECFRKLNKKFSNSIKSFPIKKEELTKIINKKNIKTISNIVHPYVRLNLIKFLKKNNKKKYVVLDIPLLIENRLNKTKDIIVFINTKKKTIEQRLRKRSNYNKKIINILNSLQLSKKKKINFSNFIIENNFGKNNLLNQIRKIKKQF